MRMEEQKNHQLSNPTTPNMSPTLSSSNAVAPTLDNVLMDIDSNPEVDQVAQDVEMVLQQAQEKVRLVAEAWERCQGGAEEAGGEGTNSQGHEAGHQGSSRGGGGKVVENSSPGEFLFLRFLWILAGN